MRKAKRRRRTAIDRVLRRWPSMTALARDLGLSYWTVASWGTRNKIPEQWRDLVLRSANRRGIKLTRESLAGDARERH